jgi:hypothetical protein
MAVRLSPLHTSRTLPQEVSYGTNFCYWLSKAMVRMEGLGKLRHSNHDVLAYSRAHQPSMLLRAP